METEDLLMRISETRIKEKKLELFFDDKGVAKGEVEINGSLEFIQLKKQFDSVGEPIIKITSDKLVEPILEMVLSNSGMYPVRTLCVNQRGEPLEILNYTYDKLPLNDTLIVEATSGSPKTKLEVLIRYA